MKPALRRYVVATLIVAVAVTAVVVTSQHHRLPTVTNAQAQSVLDQWQPPTGFIALARAGTCVTGPLLRCFRTDGRPDQALADADAAASLDAIGYTADQTDCGPTTTSFHQELKRFGNWRPCITNGHARHVRVTLDAFPIRERVSPTVPGFAGTAVGLNAFGPNG
jgi:hypothetical protein